MSGPATTKVQINQGKYLTQENASCDNQQS